MFILLNSITRAVANWEFAGQLLRVKTSVYSFFPFFNLRSYCLFFSGSRAFFMMEREGTKKNMYPYVDSRIEGLASVYVLVSISGRITCKIPSFP
jgi:hypothetical protein